MTIIEWRLPARRGRGGNRTARIRDHLCQEARIRLDLRHLSELSEEILRDMGLHRGEIPLAVGFGRQT